MFEKEPLLALQKCKINASCLILTKPGILTGREKVTFYYRKVP